MKVGFAVSDLGRGGGQILIKTYANELAASGHEVYLAVDEGPRDLLAELDPSVSIIERRRISELPRLDLALATWWATGLWVIEMAAESYGQFMQSVEDRFYGPTDHEARRRAGLIQTLGWPTITESSWIRDYLVAVVPGIHVEYVRNGMDKQVFPPSRRPPRTGSDPLRVVVEGTSAWFKGVDSVFAGLARTQVPIMIDYVSAQELSSVDAASLASNPHILQLNQHTGLTQLEFGRVLREADVFVKFSRVEGMPGPPLEAMHCGCVVIATPVSGIDEYAVHGYNSLLVPFDDPSGLGNWLARSCPRGPGWSTTYETGLMRRPPQLADRRGELGEFETALCRIQEARFHPLVNRESVRRLWHWMLSSGEASTRVWRRGTTAPSFVGIDHEASLSGDCGMIPPTSGVQRRTPSPVLH